MDRSAEPMAGYRAEFADAIGDDLAMPAAVALGVEVRDTPQGQVTELRR